MMQLTNENYYSLDADRAYMSYSQYKNFKHCEAMALAKLAGWKEEPSTAMLVGSYVDAAIEGTLDKFKNEHSEMFKKDGGLKSDFVRAEQMINVLNSDPLVMRTLTGEKQPIVTGFWAGTQWKCKLDNLNRPNEFITDLKKARSLDETFWVDGKRLSFIEYYGYIGQLASYRKIEQIHSERDYPYSVYLTIVTSEDPPDKIVISFDDDRLEDELIYIEKSMPRVLAVKSGQEKPRRCERCSYCRETKKLPQVFDYHEMIDIYMFGYSFEDYRRANE